MIFLQMALSRRLTAVNREPVARNWRISGGGIDGGAEGAECEELQQKTNITTACTFNHLNFGLVFWDGSSPIATVLFRLLCTDSAETCVKITR